MNISLHNYDHHHHNIMQLGACIHMYMCSILKGGGVSTNTAPTFTYKRRVISRLNAECLYTHYHTTNITTSYSYSHVVLFPDPTPSERENGLGTLK